MDKESINDLAKGILNLLKEYGIETEGFVMNIRVSREYYEAIKHNFPERTGIAYNYDYALTERGPDWAITLGYSHLLAQQETDHTSTDDRI